MPTPAPSTVGLGEGPVGRGCAEAERRPTQQSTHTLTASQEGGDSSGQKHVEVLTYFLQELPLHSKSNRKFKRLIEKAMFLS